jgi:hypothetical protein
MNLCYMESRTVACSFIVVTRAGNGSHKYQSHSVWWQTHPLGDPWRLAPRANGGRVKPAWSKICCEGHADT